MFWNKTGKLFIKMPRVGYNLTPFQKMISMYLIQIETLPPKCQTKQTPSSYSLFVNFSAVIFVHTLSLIFMSLGC